MFTCPSSQAGDRDLTPAMVEAGGLAPEQAGERIAIVESAD
jgi:hypothetical protein